MMTTIQKLIDKKNPKMWGAGSIEKEMFSCDLCSRDGFKSIIALQSHMRDAHKYFDSLCTTSLTESINLPSFPCGICKRLFRSKFGLISHWQDAHNDLFVFFDKSNATSSFSEQRTYCCTICNRNLKSLIGLLAHQRDAHYFKSAQCDPPLLDDWPDKIIAEIYLVEQISSKDISPLILPCKHCRRSFRALLDLRAHERDSHGVDIINNNYYNDNNTNNACSNDTIPCNQCRRVFRTMFGLYIHQRDAHGLVPKSISTDGGKRLPCDHCGYMFSSDRDLQVHLGTCHPFARRLKCCCCQKCFVTSYSLQQHMLAKHPSVELPSAEI